MKTLQQQQNNFLGYCVELGLFAISHNTKKKISRLGQAGGSCDGSPQSPSFSAEQFAKVFRCGMALYFVDGRDLGFC
jgi:hypothetical protein